MTVANIETIGSSKYLLALALGKWEGALDIYRYILIE